MGILTRQQGEMFVISSDHQAGASHSRRAPARTDSAYGVWTGERWSETREEALCFASLEDADEYVRANFSKIFG